MRKKNFLIRLGEAYDTFKGAPMLVPPNFGGSFLSSVVSVDSKGKVTLDFGSNSDVTRALNDCPPVSFIIGKIADSVCEGTISVISKTTGEETTTPIALEYLDKIDNPNEIQNRNQFISQIVFNHLTSGYSVNLKNKSFLEGESSGTWALPSELVEIDWIDKSNYYALYKNDILDLVKSIKFDGEYINKEDVFITTRSSNYRNSIVIPVPPLEAAKTVIENLITNYEGRGKLMDSPAFILSDAGGNNNPQALGLKDPDQKEITRKLSDSHGLSGDKSKIIVTRAAVKLEHISFPIASMQFDVMEKADVITLAECLGYPPELLGIYGNSNVSERDSAERSLYRRTTMPLMNSILQQLAIGFGMPEQYEYKSDYSHIEALQADEKRKSEILKNNVVSVRIAVRSNLMTYGVAMQLLEHEADKKYSDKYYYQLPDELKEGFDASINQNTNNVNSSTQA